MWFSFFWGVVSMLVLLIMSSFSDLFTCIWLSQPIHSDHWYPWLVLSLHNPGPLSSSGMCVGVGGWVGRCQLTTAGLSTTVPGGMTTHDMGSWDTPVERFKTPPVTSFFTSSPLPFLAWWPRVLRSDGVPSMGTMGKPKDAEGNAEESRVDLVRPSGEVLKDKIGPTLPGGELGQPSALRSSGWGLRGERGRPPPRPCRAWPPRRAAAAPGMIMWAVLT